MEDRNATVTGYPPNQFLMGQPRAHPGHAAATTNNCTAYPFVVRVQAPPTQYNHSRTSHAPPPQGEKVTKRQWIAFSIGIICLLSLLFLLNFLSNQPPKIRVESVSVSPFNVSALNTVTANWDIRFYFKFSSYNGNFYYERPQVSVFYKEVKLVSSMAISPLYRYNNHKSIILVSDSSSSPSSSVSVTVTQGVAKAIELDRSIGVVNFTMFIDGIFRSNGRDSGRDKQMKVICEDVKVGFSHNATAGTMLGDPRKCKVHHPN